ncbi:N-acetylmuramate alpha-1-phosphate uridylyltransferase MurU [sulfur-oxidizing endosymbiont of Gigantopelta aegis]|uniref:N-acetylmuramate alpha-1-phosphate uridylyltransferase MurU n=1 Tax=sulfur-oxidizing endosymbiont of Gigantopelta aegis TaxID=2794934 RepID=UPI0018DE9C1E|nr:nucleotidyltransferase family protein [sulfur-oxidizing endosymbiont of Gigantopelta aegis]
MKAMILAAGRGERMRPLTDTRPKPLLTIAEKSLIEYHIEALVKVGINDIVINHAWLGEQIEAKLAAGANYGATIQYSREEQALETAGGIKKALSLLGDEAFVVVNADVFTDFPYGNIVKACQNLATSHCLAHLILVNNPEHHPDGDFYCQNKQVIDPIKHPLEKTLAYTFSGIACYQPTFFSDLDRGKQALAPMLRSAMEKQQVSGEIYQGDWWDIGTPQRLEDLNRRVGTALSAHAEAQ